MEALRLLREKRNISQNVLAEAVGVTQPAISAYEKGSKQPSLDTLKKLAIELDCSTDYLLYGREKQEKHTGETT